MEREKIIFLQSVAQFLSRESIVVGVMRKNRDATPRFVFVTMFVDHLTSCSIASFNSLYIPFWKKRFKYSEFNKLTCDKFDHFP